MGDDDRANATVSADAGRHRLASYVRYAYSASVAIEFDPKKNAGNVRKHGVRLSDGDGVLDDPLALTLEEGTTDIYEERI